MKFCRPSSWRARLGSASTLLLHETALCGNGASCKLKVAITKLTSHTRNACHHGKGTTERYPGQLSPLHTTPLCINNVKSTFKIVRKKKRNAATNAGLSLRKTFLEPTQCPQNQFFQLCCDRPKPTLFLRYQNATALKSRGQKEEYHGFPFRLAKGKEKSQM